MPHGDVAMLVTGGYCFPPVCEPGVQVWTPGNTMVWSVLRTITRHIHGNPYRSSRPSSFCLAASHFHGLFLLAALLVLPAVPLCSGVVMVGDPQQLPATIFSQAGKQLALERSLFERLAAVSYLKSCRGAGCRGCALVQGAQAMLKGRVRL
jgi:hypothetical protein